MVTPSVTSIAGFCTSIYILSSSANAYAFSLITTQSKSPILYRKSFPSTFTSKAAALHHVQQQHPSSLFLPSQGCYKRSIKNTSRLFSKKEAVTEEQAITTTATTATATTNKISTVQDDQIDAPASVVFYDNVVDDDIPDGVVCARGVCVLEYDEDDEKDQLASQKDSDDSLVNLVLNSYLGPRALLAGASILYGTNFPLGAIMNEAMPPSAATCARMVLASLSLSPFLFRLDPKLSTKALLCGCFTALGYTTQSLALVDVSPATVAFLGAATVVVCPALEAVVNKKPMGVRDQPQTWLAATLCLLGVGVLELYDPVSGQITVEQFGFGDILALLQAVGFGTSFFLTERMMRGQPDQALPITAVQVSTTALICMLWCLSDGWMFGSSSAAAASYALPGMYMDPTMWKAAGAVAWTGIATTALNRFVETTALGKMSSAEASVILATEPLWAALFAALLLNSTFGLNDYVGGLLIVVACLANTLKPEDFENFFGKKDNDNDNDNNNVNVADEKTVAMKP